MSLPTNISLIGTTISQGAGSVSYSITANDVSEITNSGVINVSTTNVSDGTTLYWNITPSADFDTSSGSFTITSNAGTINVSPSRDYVTEGTETYTINIRTGSVAGTIVATGTANILDTTTPTMYRAFVSPYYYVFVSSSGGGYSYYWEDVYKGNTGATSITPGDGYTYTVGALQDTISDKSGTNSYYEITRS